MGVTLGTSRNVTPSNAAVLPSLRGISIPYAAEPNLSFSHFEMTIKLRFPISATKRYALVAACGCTAICFWVALYRSYERSDNLPWRGYHSNEIVDAFNFPAIESESVKSICGETTWNESLVFTCNGPIGGVGNVRNSVLNCVRYAISAGASLVLPTIVLRNASDISHIRTGMNTDFSHIFDTKHFLDSIRLSCSSLKIHRSISDIGNFSNARNAISLLPESVVDGDIPHTGLPDPSSWRSQFYTCLEQYAAPTVIGPIIIDLERSYLQYPIYSDGSNFALSFGSILKFRNDVRFLATKVLQNMSKAFKFDLDLTQQIIPNAFFGVHLRTEKDAVEAWPADDWTYGRYDKQSAFYLDQAPRSNSSVIYVASGNLSEVARFATDASPLQLPVVTKFDMLKGRDLKRLEALTWDQQALVDFLVMLKASDFAGVAHSSFAWNIALKRHVYAKEKNHLDGLQMLSDELSQVYGPPRMYPEYAACLWP